MKKQIIKFGTTIGRETDKALLAKLLRTKIEMTLEKSKIITIYGKIYIKGLKMA